VSEIVVAPAPIEDLEIAGNLRAIMAIEMGRDWDREHPGWRRRYVEYFRGKQQRDEAQWFFAYAGEEVVGMAAVSFTDTYRTATFGQPRALINAVYVQPAFRRRGIGAGVVAAAVAWARARGCSSVSLRASDEGRRLYERLGFVEGAEMVLAL
jgi:GNAT superfamily N-acetyltransferase